MSLRYGIPPVDPTRRICFNCQHFLVSVDPHSGWGECELARTNLFNHRLRDGRRYMAYHTKARQYHNPGCKKRFKAVTDDA